MPSRSSASPAVAVSYETGPAYVAQNDGRYGAGGSAFDADEVGQRANLLRAERASVELAFGRHRVIALYAPFQVGTRVTLDESLVFRDTTFAAGEVVDHGYRFNGYRASYLYAALTGTLTLEAGASVQVRDADVSFSAADGTRYRNQSDIGFVPALKVRATYTPTTAAWAALEADGSSTFGLVGDTSGALYDVALTVGRSVHPRADIFANVRLLGGGADVPDQQIDNWANFVSASLGLRIALER